MTDQVLNILKFALLGLLYLFFARVLWAVWSEVRTPKRRPAQAEFSNQHFNGPPAENPQAPALRQQRAQSGRSSRVGRIVILEPSTRRGTSIAMQGEITLGRDPSCTITIDDDAFISQLHLRMYDFEGQPMLEDLGSTNGTFHNGSKIVGAKLLNPGDRIQVGTTVIEAQ
jgi:pSer/pThr/pTyr-binding forkhead associated (FHA) protein